MLYPGLLHPEPLPLQQSTVNPHLLRRQTNTVLSQSLWGLWLLVHTRYVWVLWASLADMGFDSKHNFAPSTNFLGLLLCPWMWDISSKLLQALHIHHSSTYHLAGASLPLDVWYHLTVTPVLKSRHRIKYKRKVNLRRNIIVTPKVKELSQLTWKLINDS